MTDQEIYDTIYLWMKTETMKSLPASIRSEIATDVKTMMLNLKESLQDDDRSDNGKDKAD